MRGKNVSTKSVFGGDSGCGRFCPPISGPTRYGDEGRTKHVTARWRCVTHCWGRSPYYACDYSWTYKLWVHLKFEFFERFYLIFNLWKKQPASSLKQTMMELVTYNTFEVSFVERVSVLISILNSTFVLLRIYTPIDKYWFPPLLNKLFCHCAKKSVINSYMLVQY